MDDDERKLAELDAEIKRLLDDFQRSQAYLGDKCRERINLAARIEARRDEAAAGGTG